MTKTRKQCPPPEAFYTVRDLRQARVLTDPESRKFLEPFLAREKSASQAASQLGCRLDTLLYRIKTFIEADLLKVAGERKRSGRPIKLYRTVADAYFVPIEMTPYADIEERLEKSFALRNKLLVPALAGLLREQGWEGQSIYRAADGEVWSEASRESMRAFDLNDPSLPTAMQFSADLKLPAEAARTLRNELFALWKRYHLISREACESPSAKTYLLDLSYVALESQ